MIECPFCISEVDPSAVACRSCGRDLAGLTYLLRRIGDLEAAVSTIEVRLSATIAQKAVDAPDGGSDLPLLPKQPAHDFAKSFLAIVILPDVLLLAAHHVLVFNLDLRPLWLLVVTLLLPIPFGFYALFKGVQGFAFWAAVFLINSAAVVFAMDLATALSNIDPYSSPSILPITVGEWIQDAEFAGSLYLSFMAGLFAGLLTLLLRYRDHPALAASRSGLALLSRHFRLALSLRTMERVAKYLSSLGAIGSAIGAVYLGIRRL